MCFFNNEPSLSVRAALAVSVLWSCFLPEGGEEAPPRLGGYVLLRFVLTLFEQAVSTLPREDKPSRERSVAVGGEREREREGRGTFSPSYSVSRSLEESL